MFLLLKTLYFAKSKTKTPNPYNMARNYEPLVQVGFRTKKEIKEKIAEIAETQGKSVSEYLADVIESIFGSENENKQDFEKIAQERAKRLSGVGKML